MTAARILVADDEREILVSCRKILERAGWEVVTASNGLDALDLLKESRYDVLLLDLRMPGRSGMEVLALARALDAQLTVIMFTAYATIENAVEAVKRGAFDYLAKPFTAEQLRLAVEQALRHREIVDERAGSIDDVSHTSGLGRILGTSESIRRVFATLDKVMRSDANILVQGETGTGKELAARTIHRHSLRRDKPFVAVDCAALPENLLESELFGHEKGAFTGADRVSRGLLEVAHTGTLFLDEIAELPLSLQVKFLRTLQEREVRHVGGEKRIPIDIRVVAATNRDLRHEIVKKTFREDLYYRLNVVTVEMPPLRARREDIPLLTNEFLRHFGLQYGRSVKFASPEVMKVFLTYAWPGNVRELQNVIQHAVLLADGDAVQLIDLPPLLYDGSPLEMTFREVRQREAEAVEKPFLVDLLTRHRGNVSAAAAEAKMTRKMIYRLALKFGLGPEQFRS